MLLTVAAICHVALPNGVCINYTGIKFSAINVHLNNA